MAALLVFAPDACDSTVPASKAFNRHGMAERFSQSSGAIALLLGATAAFDQSFGGISFHRTLMLGDAWTARLRSAWNPDTQKKLVRPYAGDLACGP